VEDIAFEPLQQRIARCLLHHTQDMSTIHVTHQDIAAQLGTAREVVSRILKQFENSGWIELSRGKITVTDRTALNVFRKKDYM
jgi:CRP/FNR family transcriptional regulator